jgi:hypothetical protein
MHKLAVSVLMAGALLSCQPTPVSETRAVEPRKQSERASLNPHGYPKLETCKPLALDDPAASARANIARDDLRPFTTFGFTPGDAPGIFCPKGNYAQLESRGGTFVSDMPDACGTYSYAIASADKMETYNRLLAADRRFRDITGCRPSTYCEEKYRKHGGVGGKADPQCPAEPNILISVAESGTVADLGAMAKAFSDHSPRSRDAITTAFGAALARAKWDNAKLLLAAGADINGRAHDSYADGRIWLGSPLEKVFNQNGDPSTKIAMAKWLFSHGLTFANPKAHQALTWAAFANDVKAVDFLLHAGASPNGMVPKDRQDLLAKGDIRSAGAGSGFGDTPFYTALAQALLPRDRRTPEAAALADAEREKAEINAVTLYRAGGRFFVGMIYDNMGRSPNIHVVSILLAAAHREDRFGDLLDRIAEGFTQNVTAKTDISADRRAMMTYIQQVKNCPLIRPAAKRDYVKLCAVGGV